MKIVNKLILCSAVLLLAACGRTPERKTGSTGKPYDVFVVMAADKWNGEAGDTLRSILYEEIPYMNQFEPRFTIFHLTPNNYQGLVTSHRNILYYQTSPRYKEPAMLAEYDVFAQPQLVVNVTGPTDSAVIAYMDENREALQKIFEIAERDRFINGAKIFTDKDLQDLVFNKFGLMINFPRGYRLRSENPDFMWISYEMPLVSQGIFIYKYPFTSRATFTEQYLLDKRNEFAALIPGPNEGTYMTTSDIITPVLSSATINDRLWFISNGFWDVKGGFMGGPFTSYTTVNTTTGEVITIDTYVYSPKYDKRNYVRQLESLMFTVEIPADTVGTIRMPEVGAE